MSDRLLSGLEVAKEFVIGVGVGIKNAYGQPWRRGRRTAIGALPTSWGAPSGASVLRSGKGPKVQVRKLERNRCGLKSRGQMGR